MLQNGIGICLSFTLTEKFEGLGLFLDHQIQHPLFLSEVYEVPRRQASLGLTVITILQLSLFTADFIFLRN